MRVVDRIADLRKELDAERAAGRTVGLVPTMGYLHDGHVSLMQRAAAECDVVVTTLFVNPLQFGAGEDLDAYPRDLDGDTDKAATAGVALLFAPPVEEMYPGPGPLGGKHSQVLTSVHVAGVSEGLCGAARPGHFDGVATVVAKLFAIAGPCRAYFGEKDFQQLAVIRRLAHDLSFPVEVVGCPIVRDADGLALSSRNVYLSADERRAALVLPRALDAGKAAIEGGETDPEAVRRAMAAVVATEPLVHLEYAEVVGADDLRVPGRLAGDLRLLVAARVGRARLIDNTGVTI
jgi:pantoate--beta-alanine ligase